MSDVLETLQGILSKKLPDDQVQELMAELTIASGNGAVAIEDATEAVIITGNQNIIGDNNRVVINQSADPIELVKILRNLLNEEQLTIKQISNETRAKFVLDKSSLSASEKETLQAFLLKAGKLYLNRRFDLIREAEKYYISRENLKIKIDISDRELFNLARLKYLKLFADPPGIIFLPKVMGDDDG